MIEKNENFGKYLKFENIKPTKKILAEFIGLTTEGGFRRIEKDEPQKAEQINLDFKGEKNPFLSLEDYVNFHYPDDDFESKCNEIKNAVDHNEIAGFYYTDGNNKQTLYIPSVTPYFKDMEKLILEQDEKKKTKVISIANHRGGSGKTTAVTNLSAIFALMGKKVLIVDADSQGNSTLAYNFTREEFKYSLPQLIKKINDDDIEIALKESIINVDLNSNFENGVNGSIDIIGNNAVDEEEAQELFYLANKLGTIENTLRRLISFIKDDYDYVFIDLPPRLDLFLSMSVMASKYFIFALAPESFSDRGIPSIINPITKRAKIYEREIGEKFLILGGIMSRVENNINFQKVAIENSQISLENILGEEYGIMSPMIPKNVSIGEVQMMNLGAVVLYKPMDRINRYYFDLSISILSRIYTEDLKERVGE